MLRPASQKTLALLLAALALALVAGCGNKGAGGEKGVRDTLDRFETAVTHGDVSSICKQLLSKSVVQKVNSVGLPCEVALRSLQEVRRPKLKVLRVKVRDKKAFATVRTNAAGQPPSEDTIRLIDEKGSWRIDDLASAAAGPPAPASPAP